MMSAGPNPSAFDAASQRRTSAGALAQGAGAAFEQWLAAHIFQPLHTAGVIARFDKLNPEMYAKNLHPHGVWFRPRANSGGDWVLLLSGGRYCVVESKSVAGCRFPESCIPSHQQRHLRAAERAGAGAFLALRFTGDLTPAYLVPWADVPWEVARTARSVRPELLARWAIRNWLDAKRILTGT